MALSATYPPAGLANFRCIKIGSDNVLALCGASDTNRIGFSEAGQGDPFSDGVNWNYERATGSAAANGRLLSEPTHPSEFRPIWLEADAGGVFTVGGTVYQAASGRISHVGSVKVGVMNAIIRASNPTLWEIFLV